MAWTPVITSAAREGWTVDQLVIAPGLVTGFGPYSSQVAPSALVDLAVSVGSVEEAHFSLRTANGLVSGFVRRWSAIRDFEVVQTNPVENGQPRSEIVSIARAGCSHSPVVIPTEY
jgi:hypothetical protein